MIEGINSSLAVNAQGTNVKTANDKAVQTFDETAKQDLTIKTGDAPQGKSFFSLDSTSDVRTVLQVIDASNGEIVRQFPTENQLKAYSRAQEVQQSVTTVSAEPASVEAPAPEINLFAENQAPSTPIADLSSLVN
jgi:uncharacterized FlaG/YvyC family protein